MDQVHVIRHKVLVEGKSVRAAARELGFSRNTVRKYLTEPEPVRKEAGPRARPAFERAQPRMEALLEAWSGRTTPKQRITGTRLHKALKAEGIDVGITLVRDYLRERQRQRSEVFIPLVHRPGDEAQIDFFEVTLDVAGERQKAWMFVMRLMYSSRDFVRFYQRCDQLSFLDGHVRAFAHFGRVPQRCIYDNLKPAVRKVMFPKRMLSHRFQALVSHYLFEPCFARPGEGHDKGGVEARGKGIRLQHLVPIPQGETLEALSQQVQAAIDAEMHDKRNAEGRTVAERFEEERPQMLGLPERPFEARRAVVVTVSSKSLVKVEGAWYAVPCAWKQLEATAYVGVEDVRIVCRGEEVVQARQPFGTRKIVYRYYLPELATKPQAVRQVAPELIDELGETYGQLWRLLVDTYGPHEAARTFARVLGAVTDHGEEAVRQAIEGAMRDDEIEAVCLRLGPPRPTVPKSIEVPQSLAQHEVEAACVESYDVLLVGEPS